MINLIIRGIAHLITAKRQMPMAAKIIFFLEKIFFVSVLFLNRPKRIQIVRIKIVKNNIQAEVQSVKV
jgi:hypothetical protein